MNRGPIIALIFSAVISVGIIIASTRHGSEQKDAPVAGTAGITAPADSPGAADDSKQQGISKPAKESPPAEERAANSDRSSLAEVNELVKTPPVLPASVPKAGENPALGTAEYTPPPQPPANDSPLVTEAPEEPPEGMVWIPGGTFTMGGQDDLHKPDEHPVHEVALDGFYMDATEVTNAEYARFVEATGYVTYAERSHTREEYAGQVPDISMIKEEDLQPGSICFNPNFDASEIDLNDPLWPYHVWKLVHGADWRHPHGPDSSIEGLDDHPVVHVNYEDVIAYCDWAGKRLPTEAEWEYAARGGLEGKSYPWGDERQPDGEWVFNMWQGVFPVERKVEDGYKHSSPVKSFPPNGYGLYDMSGNVWEWTGDYYRPDYYKYSRRRNPPGPVNSYDPLEPQYVKRVQRGGSYMCNENYCTGYRVSSRMKGDEISGTFHCGFRCVIGHDELEKYRNAPRQTEAKATADDKKTAKK